MHLKLLIIALLAMTFHASAKDLEDQIFQAEKMIHLKNLVRAEALATDAYQEFEKTGDRKGLGEATFVLGLVHKSQKKTDEAINEFRQALVLFNSIDYYSGIARVKFALGNAFGVIGDTDRKCDMYRQSLIDFETSKATEPNPIFWINPNYTSFEEMVKDFSDRRCA